MRSALLLVPIAAAAAVGIAGCGAANTSAGGGHTAPAATPNATHTKTVALPPVAVGTTTAAQPSPSASAPASAPSAPAAVIPTSTHTACRTSDLRMSLGKPEGTAGKTILPIHFTNDSVGTCTITGYPGVSYVAPGTGKQVGAAAERSTGHVAAVTLQPGQEATALSQAPDIDAGGSDCQATAASGLRIYPPDNTGAAYLPFSKTMTVCSTGAGRLQVMPAAAGNGN